MKTKFQFLYPRVKWGSVDYHKLINKHSIYRGISFPTEISYHSLFNGWRFNFQIFGLGFSFEKSLV